MTAPQPAQPGVDLLAGAQDPLITREPVRLPIWVASILSIIVSVSIGLLSGMDWRSCTITGLTIFSTQFLGTEVARQRSYSESSVWLATTQARQDERARAQTPTITVASGLQVGLTGGSNSGEIFDGP